MKTFTRNTIVLILSVIGLNAFGTPLDDYVAKPDPSYKWQIAKRIHGKGFSVLSIAMTSQTFLNADLVDHPEWKHVVYIVKPDNLSHDTAMLFITGGHIPIDPNKKIDDMMIKIALATQSIVSVVHQIPNEPLVFADDKKPRTEDDIIAYTWKKYKETEDPLWLAYLPMTKAAVRAMDTVQAAVKQEWGKTVKDFMVAGGSKRGWTTWTTAAVDKRVKAICPIVIDVLNTAKSMKHHHAAYGFWAPSVGSYVKLGLMDNLDDPVMQKLLHIVDPYFYRSRYTMPKFILNACGDQFFLPDSSQFYYDKLPGEKRIRYVPNTDHGMGNSDAVESLVSWYWLILNDVPRPAYSWKKKLGRTSGSLTVTPKTKPVQVNLWQATNPEARDFRLETLGAKWTHTSLQPDSRGRYIARVKAPAKGWTAFMVELVFDTGAPYPTKFTTEVAVVPDILPYAHANLKK